jgi:hemolysin activation/secretion protein
MAIIMTRFYEQNWYDVLEVFIEHPMTKAYEAAQYSTKLNKYEFTAIVTGLCARKLLQKFRVSNHYNGKSYYYPTALGQLAYIQATDLTDLL